MKLLAVDGALANTGVAFLDTAHCPAEPPRGDVSRVLQAAHGLVFTKSLTTAPRVASVRRCIVAADWLEAIVSELAPDLVLLEVPARDGAYARVAARQRTASQLNATSEALMNRGIGALAAAARGSRVVEIAADTQSKAVRRTQVDGWCRAGERPRPPNEHEADAAWYAVTAAARYLENPNVFRDQVRAGVLVPQLGLPGLLPDVALGPDSPLRKRATLAHRGRR